MIFETSALDTKDQIWNSFERTKHSKRTIGRSQFRKRHAIDLSQNSGTLSGQNRTGSSFWALKSLVCAELGYVDLRF